MVKLQVVSVKITLIIEILGQKKEDGEEVIIEEDNILQKIEFKLMEEVMLKVGVILKLIQTDMVLVQEIKENGDHMDKLIIKVKINRDIEIMHGEEIDVELINMVKILPKIDNLKEVLKVMHVEEGM